MSNAKKQRRAAFRKAVFGRDGHKCVFCPITVGLDAHHITNRNEMPNGGYVVENGITLCAEHHLAAETCGVGSGWHIRYSPGALYELIGSSMEKAVAADKKEQEND